MLSVVIWLPICQRPPPICALPAGVFSHGRSSCGGQSVCMLLGILLLAAQPAPGGLRLSLSRERSRPWSFWSYPGEPAGTSVVISTHLDMITYGCAALLSHPAIQAALSIVGAFVCRTCSLAAGC